MNKLKKYRENHNYTFQEMANLLNISKTYYWQLENKKRRLSYIMAIKISKLFDLKPDELFYDEYNKN